MFSKLLSASPTTPTAWIEPGTVSVCLFCVMLLARGRPGSRLLVRHMKRGSETLTDVTADEFSDFLCDHPDVLLLLLLISAQFSRSHRCSLIARAPELLQSPAVLQRVLLKHRLKSSLKPSPQLSFKLSLKATQIGTRECRGGRCSALTNLHSSCCSPAR